MRLSLKFFVLAGLAQTVLVFGALFYVYNRLSVQIRLDFAEESEKIAASVAASLSGESTELSRDKKIMKDFLEIQNLDFLYLKVGGQLVVRVGNYAEDQEGGDLFTTYAEIPSRPGTEVGMGRNYSRVRQMETQFETLCYFAFAGEVLMGLLITMVMSVYLNRRVRPILRVCESISAGDFRTRLSEKGEDELSVISKGLNSMAEKLVELNKKNMDQVSQMASSSKLVALGEMAGGVAHEINTPLAIILGKANVLKRLVKESPLPSERIDKELGKIEFTVERIAKIITGLRRFARDGSRDKPELCSLTSVIEDALSLCQEKFKNQGIALTAEGCDHCSVMARPVEFSQVLVNLINNAFYAVKGQEGAYVKIKSWCENERVFIAVVDSGKGIPKAVVEKLMQPFFTTKPVGEGTGLGLSISLGIVKGMGGTLAYDPTQPNTTFLITLPLAAKTPAAAA